ncbi:MAG: SRPBCC family protein [Thermoleophilia bacterium]|nr:SRPBCC family protein [Thermoleophilia bacterium]
MTDNPPAVIDADAFTVRRTIHIDAPIDTVWRAITEPALISQWFGDAAFEALAVGARGTLSWPDYGAAPVRIEAIDEPHSISYRWADGAEYPGVPDVDTVPSTVFTFTLESVESGTRLTVVETGFESTRAPEENLESHRGGWDFELDELVALLEAAA